MDPLARLFFWQLVPTPGADRYQSGSWPSP